MKPHLPPSLAAQSPSSDSAEVSVLGLVGDVLQGQTPEADLCFPRSNSQQTAKPNQSMRPNEASILPVTAIIVMILTLSGPPEGKAASWVSSGPLNAARQGHTATLLQNGVVLVVGGTSAAPLATAELYNIASRSWTTTGQMKSARTLHTASLLRDGKVLVAGGQSGTYPSVVYASSAELYDPNTGNWTVTGSLGTGRAQHTETVLPNGKVLVVGGSAGTYAVFATAELYDPIAATWTYTGHLTTGRAQHTQNPAA